MPKLSIEGAVGIAAGVILFILDKMGIGGTAVYAVLFALAMGLCVDSVIRSDWAVGSKKRKAWGGIGMSAFYLVFGAWIFFRPQWSGDLTKLILDITASKEARWASIKLNTSELPPDAKDYNLMVIVRVQDDSVEALTDTGIAKSALFEITGEVRTIQVDLSESFIARSDAVSRSHSQMSLQFYITLIPKHIRAEQILTLADVGYLGGRQLKSQQNPEVRSATPFK